MSEAHFRATAPAFMRRLLAEMPMLNELDAAAIFGNAGHESKGLTDDQEDKPVVKGSRGGANWMQWTGPRRRQLEAFAKARGLDPNGDEAAYQFLVHELTTTEKKSVAALRQATTLKAKTIAFMESNLRPGVKHAESRVKWANIALQAFREEADGVTWVVGDGGPGPGPAFPPAPKPRIAAELMLQLQQALLDKGYPQVGQVDGHYGDKTRKAILAFEDDHGLPLTGEATVEILAQILAAAPKLQPAERAEAPPAEVREKVPEVKASWLAKVVSLGAMVISGATVAVGAVGDLAGGIVPHIAGAKEFLKPVLEVVGDVPGWGYAAAVGGVALYLWLKSRESEAAAVAAFQSGERR